VLFCLFVEKLWKTIKISILYYLINLMETFSSYDFMLSSYDFMLSSYAS